MWLLSFLPVEGDYFRGAVGSTLYIDEVELIHAAD